MLMIGENQLSDKTLGQEIMKKVRAILSPKLSSRGEIFKAEGYTTIIDQLVQGKCVEHEVDVVAWMEKELIMVEAKFHTDFNLKSDLKIDGIVDRVKKRLDIK